MSGREGRFLNVSPATVYVVTWLRAVGRLELEGFLVVSELPLTKHYAIRFSFSRLSWPAVAFAPAWQACQAGARRAKAGGPE